MKEYIIGIDLGGTFIKGGVVNGLGEGNHFVKVLTPSSRFPKEVVAAIHALIEEILKKASLKKSDVIGVGVACPGTIDGEKGVVVSASNFRWYDVPLQNMLEIECNLPVKIVNDADAALVAEMNFGVGKNYQNVVMLTLGTGIGSGVYKNGKLIGGIELGHVVVVPNGRKCACGRRGCFERYSSASALVEDVKYAMKRKNTRMAMEEKLTGETVFEYFEQDEVAKEILLRYFQRFVRGLVNCANVFQPQVIILGGGICVSLKRFLPELQKRAIEEASFPMEILIAEHQNNAGTLGAAALWL